MDFMTALPTILKAMTMGAVPILLAALGEVFSERAGLVNIGLEGVMAIGAFVGFAVGKMTGNLWVGLFVAMLAGVLHGAVMPDGLLPQLKLEQGVAEHHGLPHEDLHL